MKLTKSEEVLIEELQSWRESFFEHEPKQWEKLYDNWINQAFSLIPAPVQGEIFAKLDDWLFHLNSLLRGTQLQNEAFERILRAAQSIDERVNEYTDMQSLPVSQLTFIAEQQAAKHRLYSLIQGGLTGSGQNVFMSSDFFALLVIHLRSIQLIAMSFGNNVQSPVDLHETLKVFTVAMMPDRMKSEGLEILIEDLRKDDKSFYLSDQQYLADISWIDEPLKHVLKVAFISMMNKKKPSRLKWLSIATGACINYKTTRQVTDFAIKYYQMKHLLRKNSDI